MSRLLTLTAQIAASDTRAHIYALGNSPYPQRLQPPSQSSRELSTPPPIATWTLPASGLPWVRLGTFQRLLELDFLDPPHSGLMVALEPEAGNEAWKGEEVAEEVEQRRRHIRCRVAAETGGITFAVP